ncbi:MAG TPA: Hsp70 family protein, partial [Spirochaetales bacterium]|nr:Hsp70 family protein [Spirochaetales bacterium]
SLAGLFLREVKRRADAASGVACAAGVVEEAVVARYRAACAYAGFEEVHFVPEPVAAAAGMAGELSGTVLVFDFGGGTLDVAVAEPGADGVRILSSAGRDLGGYLLNEDVSRARITRHFGSEGKIRTMKGSYLDMPRWITDQVASFYALPLSDLAATRRLIKELIYDARPIDKPRLRGLAEFLDRNLTFELFDAIDAAKIALSVGQESEIAFALPPHVSFVERLTRAEFEGVIGRRVDEARALVLEALERSGRRPADVSTVIRVGGSSRVPAFAAMLESLFPGRVREGAVFTSIASGLLAAHDSGLSAA